MMCFLCGKDAVAVCRYCGRAVCKDHIKEGPVMRQGIHCEVAIGAEDEWLEIGNAVWCGICHIMGRGRKTQDDKFFRK